jgi:predicted amidophosphoribosyltransferase
MRVMIHQLNRPPSVCHICHAWPSQPLCVPCVERFAQPKRRCPSCALTHSPGQISCRNCAEHPSPLDACVAAVSYDFPWTDCIARFKFMSEPSLGRNLANLMRHAPWIEPALEAASLVIPMPLTLARLRERGYNQALELARYLAPGKTNTHTLLRCGDSAHQVGATRETRLAQVSDTFWLAPPYANLVRGQRIVLLDDVMTTGASL